MYYLARRWLQVSALVGAVVGLAAAAVVGVTGGPTWAVLLFVLTAIPNGALAAGWVPKGCRPLLGDGS
jgi:predicted PurR-regulated permease PerM